MSDSKMYDILGKFNNLEPKLDPVKETAKEPVYESVEARGDIMEAVRSLEEKYMGFKKTVAAVKKGGSAEDPEAVAAAIGRKKYGKEKFQKAAAAGKKLGEAAKPDFLDVDKDGDKKEPFKKAVKDKEEVNEVFSDEEAKAQRDATKERAYQARRDANTKKYEKNKKASEKRAQDRARAKVAEGEYDPAAPDADAIAKRKRLQAIKDRQEDEQGYRDERNTPIRKVAGKAYGGSAQKDAPEVDDLAEKAPPGAKAERMVKHIKKGYAKDGALTKREKGIAYATAWKAHNKGQVEEGVEFGDTIKNSEAKMTKAKPAMVKESRMIQEGDYYYESIGKALAEKNPTLDTASPEFYTAVRQEMVAQGMKPNQARNILAIDEDFIMDVATSYGHYCKEVAECGAPMNSFVDGTVTQELDEIARLAGLPSQDEWKASRNVPEIPTAPAVDPTKKSTYDKSKLNPNPPVRKEETEVYNELNVEESPDTMDLEEEEMGEGNEFSGALARARASGAKEFEVDGKKYAVKEHQETLGEGVNTTITVNSDGPDAVLLIKQLAGIEPVQDQPVDGVEPVAPQPTDNTVPIQPEAEVAEEREIEHTNTPREKVAPADAAYPSGDDMHRAKKSYSDKPYRGDNPMAVKEAEEDSLWKKYSGMLKSMILK